MTEITLNQEQVDEIYQHLLQQAILIDINLTQAKLDVEQLSRWTSVDCNNHLLTRLNKYTRIEARYQVQKDKIDGLLKLLKP